MKPQDPLLMRYHEANAHDPERPDPALRENVLTQARAAARKHSAPASARPQAANDPAWRWRALGGLAVLGLASLVVLQFDRGAPDERELALGQPSGHQPAPQATPAAPVSPSPADASKAAQVAPPVAPAKPLPAAPRVAAPRTTAAPPPDPPSSSEAPEPPEAASAESPAQGSFKTAPQAQDADSRADVPAGATAGPRAQGLQRNEAPSALSSRRAATVPSPHAALLAAAARGTVDDARDALAQGADVNGSNADGRTALMRAAQRGDTALVRLLLDAGADPQRTDRQGLRAADIAAQAGHDALLPLLDGAPPR